jgi:PKHD-type hydroxylase
MILKRQKVFTKKQCESIISYHSDWTENIGSVGAEKEIDSSFRQCITYTPPSIEHIPNWVESVVYKKISSANKQSYNFDLGKGEFQMTLLRYDLGDHYKAHIDIGLWEIASRRKLSFTLLLNDSYEGGELKFLGVKDIKKSNIKTGDMVIFPSYLTHKIEPVTSGVRWALVGWILGDKHFV